MSLPLGGAGIEIDIYVFFGNLVFLRCKKRTCHVTPLGERGLK